MVCAYGPCLFVVAVYITVAIAGRAGTTRTTTRRTTSRDEIGDEFDLSSTDRDICAAALKEWLAKELPGDGG